ncbi:MAG: DUF4397 domain-containing protein [Myxococcales bacterium]|nr:DUF4397 domain-containing protein [Myxococcales bacterium]
MKSWHLSILSSRRSTCSAVLVGVAMLCLGCGDDTTSTGGSGGNGGSAGTGGSAGMGGSGGAGGTEPTTAIIRIAHMNTDVGMVDVVDGGGTVVLEESLATGEVTRTFEREAGPRTFDFLGPGGGDLRFSTEEQDFEAGAEYVLVLVAAPTSMMPNANQTVTVQIGRDAVNDGEAGLVLVHGSERDAFFESADITLQRIGEPGEPTTLETGVAIGARTSIVSLPPAEYAFALYFDPPDPNDLPIQMRARRTFVAGEFVVAIAGEALVNDNPVEGWFALTVGESSSRDALDLLVGAPSL